MPKIFISHAQSDFEIIVSPFLDMLIMGLGISREEIYCTSDRDIPTGTNFPEHIKSNIQTAELVIMILTENYVNSHFCLNEMGAAWANNQNIYPIVIPPANHRILDRSALRGVTNVLTALSEDDLHQLRDEFTIKNLVGRVRSPEFNSRGRIFLKAVADEKNRIEEAGPKFITLEEFNKIKSELDDLTEAYDEKNRELDEREKLIEKLKKAKDTTEVTEIMQSSMPLWDHLIQQIENVRDKLSKLDWMMVSLLFHRQAFDHSFQPNDSSLWSAINKLQARKFVNVDEGEISINSDHPLVKSALTEIEHLHELADGCPHDIYERFVGEFGVDIDVTNLDFWRIVLDQKGIELSK